VVCGTVATLGGGHFATSLTTSIPGGGGHFKKKVVKYRYDVPGGGDIYMGGDTYMEKDVKDFLGLCLETFLETREVDKRLRETRFETREISRLEKFFQKCSPRTGRALSWS